MSEHRTRRIRKARTPLTGSIINSFQNTTLKKSKNSLINLTTTDKKGSLDRANHKNSNVFNKHKTRILRNSKTTRARNHRKPLEIFRQKANIVGSFMQMSKHL